LQIATVDNVTTTIAAATVTSAALLNSGTVGVGEVAEGDEVGLADVDVLGLGDEDPLEESDKIETALEPLSAMNNSLLAES